MQTRRSFYEIQVYLEPVDFMFSCPRLHLRQLKRIIAIHNKFANNITTVMWTCLTLSIKEAVELLQTVPKLESITFAMGAIDGLVGTETLALPKLTKLNIIMVSGFYQLANLLSVSSIVEVVMFTMNESSNSLRTFLLKQTNLKSIEVCETVDSTFIKHLQLEKLGLNKVRYLDNQLREILSCQPNLKGLSFEKALTGNSFKWICKNMKHLEKFDARVTLLERNFLTNIKDLEKLRSFKTNLYNISHIYNVKNDTLATLRIDEPDDLSPSLQKTIVGVNYSSMVQNFPNISNLELQVDSIMQFCNLLDHFKNITKYSGWIEHPETYRFSNKEYPNMKHLSIINEITYGDMSLLVDIVQTMPNLEHLSVNITMMFDSNFMKEFIDKITNLKYFEMTMLEFDDDFTMDGNFLDILRRLHTQLKCYKIVFKTTRSELYSRILIGILSKEFQVRSNKVYAPYTFTVSKGGNEAFKKSK